MPHVASELELMLNNLLPYLQHEYGDEVLILFTEEAKKEAKDNQWGKEHNHVVCATDMYTEEEEEDDLDLEQARIFIIN